MPELDKPKRAALYVRVSTLDQNENSQRDDLTRYAERIGWATELYVDHGYSGRKDSRPALNRLMTDVRAGKLDVVCVRSLDRWARSIRHIVLTMEEFAERRVSFVSLREQVDPASPWGKAMFQSAAVFAELEANLIRERTLAGLAAAKRRGAPIGRPKAKLPPIEDLRVLLEREGSVRGVARCLNASESTVRRALRA
jgi:DNA invertase Pin-like site-specific DNA recombinase